MCDNSVGRLDDAVGLYLQGGRRTFGLTAARVEDGRSPPNRQILVPEPQALKALDSEQIVVRLAGSEMQYLGGARWSDRLPRLVAIQARRGL